MISSKLFARDVTTLVKLIKETKVKREQTCSLTELNLIGTSFLTSLLFIDSENSLISKVQLEGIFIHYKQLPVKQLSYNQSIKIQLRTIPNHLN